MLHTMWRVEITIRHRQGETHGLCSLFPCFSKPRSHPASTKRGLDQRKDFNAVIARPNRSV
jgi:hypothetical protein